MQNGDPGRVPRKDRESAAAFKGPCICEWHGNRTSALRGWCALTPLQWPPNDPQRVTGKEVHLPQMPLSAGYTPCRTVI